MSSPGAAAIAGGVSGGSAGAVSVGAVVAALRASFVTLVSAPLGLDQTVETVALLDGDELRTMPAGMAAADVALLVGVRAAEFADWLAGPDADADAGDEAGAGLSTDRGRRPPRLIAVKGVQPELLTVAARHGVAVADVHPQVRWEGVLATVRGLLEQSRSEDDLASSGHDLTGLAQAVAAMTGGMVTIEDERAQVLAYSASTVDADELRRLSILGREGPADYLHRLDQLGVYSRLRRSDGVVEVPADAAFGMRHRLAIGIRQRVPGTAGRVDTGTAEGGAARPAVDPRAFLGAIWVQQGAQPLSADSGTALRGAAAVAARLIQRSRSAPSTEAVQIQRLLGALGGGVDVPSLAASLAIPAGGPVVVVGFAVGRRGSAVDVAPSDLRTGDGRRAEQPADEDATEVAALLRLHAGAYASDSLVTAIGSRAYVLLPRAGAVGQVVRWVTGLVERATPGLPPIRAVVATPVATLAEVAAARREVDRVLDQPTVDAPVTTLADSRTPVLLGEVLDLVAGRPDLVDPRLAALEAHDVDKGSDLVGSLGCYLRQGRDVRASAELLHVHPNTLRHRLRRAQAVLGMDLDDPSARLLLELQLAVRTRRSLSE